MENDENPTLTPEKLLRRFKPLTLTAGSPAA